MASDPSDREPAGVGSVPQPPSTRPASKSVSEKLQADINALVKKAMERRAGFGVSEDPIYGPRLSDDIDALSSTLGWAPWMRLFRRHEQRLVDRRRAAREPQERATPAA
jgi:hypothetical protein